MRRRTTRLAVIVFAVGSFAALTSGAAAQIWQGDATLGMAIRSAKGSALQGALVTLAYRDLGFGDGPSPRLTDARGEVNFTGLSAGTWSLKVDHPEHLSYLATVVIRRGKKPQILTEFLEATGEGRQTLRVKMLKGISGERGVAIAASESSRTPAAVAVPDEPEEPETAATPEPARSASASPAVASPPAVGGPPTVSAPAPEADRGSSPAVISPAADDSVARSSDETTPEAPGAIAEEISTVEPAEAEPHGGPPEPGTEAGGRSAPLSGTPSRAPVSPPDTTPQPTSPAVQRPQPEATDTDTETGEPSSVPAATPTVPIPEAPGTGVTAKAASPPASARQTSREELPLLPDTETLRSYGDRSCLECKPGEWSVVASVRADAGGQSACPELSESQLRSAVEQIVFEQADRLSRYAGPLPLDSPDRPELVDLLGVGSCRLAGVVLPEGARFTGFTFHASDTTGSGDCLADQECEIGSARWLFNPGIIRASGTTVVFSVFDNSAGMEARTGSIVAYFVPRPGWTP